MSLYTRWSVFQGAPKSRKSSYTLRPSLFSSKMNQGGKLPEFDNLFKERLRLTSPILSSLGKLPRSFWRSPGLEEHYYIVY